MAAITAPIGAVTELSQTAEWSQIGAGLVSLHNNVDLPFRSLGKLSDKTCGIHISGHSVTQLFQQQIRPGNCLVENNIQYILLTFIKAVKCALNCKKNFQLVTTGSVTVLEIITETYTLDN